MMKRAFYMTLFMFLIASSSFAHQPVIVGKEAEVISDPEISRAFYDVLAGAPRSYFIVADRPFSLYFNLLVPKNTNPRGRYSARVYQLADGRHMLVADVKSASGKWHEFYEPFGGDTYLNGPEFRRQVPAGRYEIEVYSADNQGKYVLAVGETEAFGPKEIAQVYINVPILKMTFFGTSPLTFLLTPFGIVLIVLIILIAGLVYLFLRRRRSLLR